MIRTREDFAAAFNAPPETIERLVLYEKLLRQWQKAVNLVAPATLDAVWHRHFADSAQLVSLAPPGARSWIDLGSGAGFPGLVAAIILAGTPRATPTQTPSARGEGWGEGQRYTPTSAQDPAPHPGPLPAAGVRPLASNLHASRNRRSEGSDPVPPSGERHPPHFTLIESDTRKCAFLREVARQTGVAVDILSRRAESARTSVNKDLPRIVSARALAPLDRLLDLAEPLSPPGTTLLFPKGREVTQELQMAESRWRFQVALVESVTDRHGRIAVITNLERKAKD